MLPAHGLDGWTLEEYFWDSCTGEAELVYEHPDQPEPLVLFQMQKKYWTPREE